MLISNWPAGGDGASEEDDPFWAAAVDDGMPVCIHINIISRDARIQQRAAAAKAGNKLYGMARARRRRRRRSAASATCSRTAAGNISQSIFTGVFQRFPELQRLRGSRSASGGCRTCSR